MVYALELSDPAVNPAAKFTDFATILNILIPNIMIGISLIFFVMLFLVGYRYMNSDGKAEELQKIKSLIIYAGVGIGIVLASYVLVKLAGGIFQISIPF